jgi:IS4 transposase
VDKSLGVWSDQDILLFSKQTKAKYPKRLRRITFRDEEQNWKLVFLTNNYSLSSDTIAALYKAKWQIELFFKWIKQNLMVKSFYGTSANAVKTQIWISMIVFIVLAIMKERFHLRNNLSQLLHFFKVKLFERKSLESIFKLNDRKTDLKKSIDHIQLKLFCF